SNTSVTTCSGTFYDSGGAGGDYTSGQTFTKTFNSGNGKCLKFDFTFYDLFPDYTDKIRVYDGANTAAPLIGTFYDIGPESAIISTGTSLTFKFTSDFWDEAGGWAATISCVDKPTCGVNPAANNICSSATFITNLNGFCGNTSASYTPDSSPDLLADFCGSIENNSWLKFTANATTASFNVWTSNCTVGDGIQIEIFKTSDCVNFDPVSNCWNPFNDVNSTVTATGLTVGTNYYMMIDGNNGDNCNFVIGATDGIVVLPLELINFEVKCVNSKNELSWSTATEENSDYFTIEKSENGFDFYKIATINASNNSKSIRNYIYPDDSKNNSIVYYRLKIVDRNGKFTISNIISSNCINLDEEFQIYPNPTANEFTLIINSIDINNAEFIITNSKGEIQLHQIFDSENINKKIDVSSLAKGIYNIKMTTSKNVYYKKLVIDK
ncbi:MAG: T9SS type A sorting domain-containing protein, partial [Flavobacteriia bacterium]|nr:T9SS type A sorting domain-containing protein [Flavobacteriia bacterium]